jgi:hypothetical protein
MHDNVEVTMRRLVLLILLLLVPVQTLASVTDSFTSSIDGGLLSTYNANWSIAFSCCINEPRIRSQGVGTDTHQDGALYVGRTWANDQYSEVKLIDVTGGYEAAIVRAEGTA